MIFAPCVVDSSLSVISRYRIAWIWTGESSRTRSTVPCGRSSSLPSVAAIVPPPPISTPSNAPFPPPRWTYRPWRRRDEHTQRPAYYDGTPVTGPYNSEVMEDVLLMKAYGIPCGVYWIDRPWGRGVGGV